MKKLIAIILSALIVLTLAFTLTACDNEDTGCKHQSQTATNYIVKNGKVYNKAECSECGDEIEKEVSLAGTVTNNNDLAIIMQGSDFQDNSVILVKGGVYSTLQIAGTASGATIVCEQGVVAGGLQVSSSAADMTVMNMNFSENGTGVRFSGGVTGLTIKNCIFTGRANVYNESATTIYDLTIDGCTFKNIGTTGNTTAVKVTNYNGLTVKNCTFDTVNYNALQVGEKSASGTVTVQDNIFKNIGSRVLYFAGSDANLVCTVSRNYFFDNHDCYIENEDDDALGRRKTDGAYVKAKGSGSFTVGVNYWENIPEDDEKYISAIINYNAEDQVVLPQ